MSPRTKGLHVGEDLTHLGHVASVGRQRNRLVAQALRGARQTAVLVDKS